MIDLKWVRLSYWWGHTTCNEAHDLLRFFYTWIPRCDRLHIFLRLIRMHCWAQEKRGIRERMREWEASAKQFNSCIPDTVTLHLQFEISLFPWQLELRHCLNARQIFGSSKTTQCRLADHNKSPFDSSSSALKNEIQDSTRCFWTSCRVRYVSTNNRRTRHIELDVGIDVWHLACQIFSNTNFEDTFTRLDRWGPAVRSEKTVMSQ